MSELERRRLIVGISGASGAIYGIRVLELLRELDVETHLVVSRAARATIAAETGKSVGDVQALADHCHAPDDIGAVISSGSFPTLGMIVAPCSVRSLSEIAYGVTTGLLSRAADVVLKERRPLVLMLRESPLHLGHIRAMQAAAETGAILAPPMPAFYNHPKSIDDIVTHSAGRALDLVGIDCGAVKRWTGMSRRDDRS